MNSTGESFAQWLSRIEPDERFALCFVAIVAATTLIVFALGFITHTIRSVHRSRLEAELKRELLDRGLSADEIARVVESTASRTSPGSNAGQA